MHALVGVRVLFVAAVVGVVVAESPAAHADAYGTGWTSGGEIGAQAGSGGGSGGSGRGGAAGGAPKCSSVPIADPLPSNPGPLISGPLWGGHVYSVTCIDDQGNASTRVTWRPDPTPVDPQTLAQQALHSVTVPLPDIGISPSPGRGTVVNFPTWLWVDSASWALASASASAGPVTVTTTAVPERVMWDMGDGGSVTCDGPGTPYDPARSSVAQSSDCTYAYSHGSASTPDHHFVVTATVQWHATWQASGVGGGGDLGIITRSSSVGLPVGEVQALNTAAGG